jgi:hypothetical protein
MEVRMRSTKWSLVVVLPAVVVACKSASRKLSEVRSCSAITIDAKGASQCLVLQYKWSKADADKAAGAFQRTEDSTAQVSADSGWHAGAAQHEKEIRQCASDPSGDVVRCLLGYGWADARAKGTADSLWRRDAPQRRDQVLRCTRQKQMQAGACLQLYYKWSPDRSLAVDDSIRRAQMRR